MLKIKEVKTEEKGKLFFYNQLYLHEMTNYYNDVPDENGFYTYGHFDEYFIDPKRKAYFIYNDNTIIGFFMLNPYSYFNKDVDYVLAEFTIFYNFRNHGYAKKIMNIIFNSYVGEWEIKYNEKNTIAKKLWNSITEKYHPTKRIYDTNEIVLIFNNKKSDL